jgi:hypothetical protein
LLAGLILPDVVAVKAHWHTAASAMLDFAQVAQQDRYQFEAWALPLTAQRQFPDCAKILLCYRLQVQVRLSQANRLDDAEE